MGSLKDHSPPLQKLAPNQAGDIYYSTLLRFVKPLSEDFFNFLRPAAHYITPQTLRSFFSFEENTGLFQNRYHIKYTRFRTLSSRFPEKYEKKPVLLVRTTIPATCRDSLDTLSY